MLRSDLPEKYSSIISLGEPVKVFKPQNGARIIVALIIMIAGVAIFIWWDWIFGIIAFVVFFIFLWTIISKWGESAVLFQNGFAYCDGDEVQPIAWGDVATILAQTTQVMYYGIIPTNKYHYFHLWTISGKKIKLDNSFNGTEELGKLISKNVTPLQVEKFNLALDQGQVIPFGPIAIGRAQGIQIKGDLYGWNEIQEISESKGELKIKTHQNGNVKTIKELANAIPNRDAFMDIASNLLKQQKGQLTVNTNFKSQPPFIGV
jgi:hypothetical protein